MGYFEGLINASFKKDKNGQTLFYPRGISGKGYILSNKDIEVRIRVFLGRYYKISLSLIIFTGILVGVWSFLLIPFLYMWFHFGIKSLLTNCINSDEKLSYKESVINSALGHNTSTLWFLFICSIIFVVVGIFIADNATSLYKMIVGWASVIFFGVCGIVIGYMLKVKNSQANL